MRTLFLVFLIANLLVFANGLDRAKILLRHSRKDADSDKQQTVTKTAAGGAAATNTKTAAQAVGAAAAAKTQAAQTQTVKAAAAATTTTTTAAKTTVAAAAKVTAAKATVAAAAGAGAGAAAKATVAAAAKAAAAAATTKTAAAATTTTKAADAAKAGAGAAAAAKDATLFTKDANGKTIEHVTKEAPPKGMYRPVMMPSPDAVPNTYTVHPVVEGDPHHASRMMSKRSSSSSHGESSSEMMTEETKQAMQGGAKSETSPAPQQQAEETTSSSSSSDKKTFTPSDSSSDSSDDQPSFKAAAKGKRVAHVMGKDAVEAQEVSSLDNQAETPWDSEDDAFPPKYPPCSCVARPKPACCMMYMPRPAMQRPRGWWHKNAMGSVHFHHMHTPDEDPDQVASEDQQTSEEDSVSGGDDDDSSPPAAASTDDDNDETTPPTDGDDAAAATGDEMPPPSIAGDPDQMGADASTGAAEPAEPELTYSSLKALLDESLSKNHQAIVTEFSAQLQSQSSALTSHVDEVKTELLGQLKIIADHVADLIKKSDDDTHRAVIVENNIHHHHHDGDEDDDEDDDDDEDSSAADPLNGAFTTTGTLDALRSLEKTSEDLTSKLDQADTLDAASEREGE